MTSSTTTMKQRPAPDGLGLDAPESRFPLGRGGRTVLPDLTGTEGPVPLAFRFLVPVNATGGILPDRLEYDEDAQTGRYDDLPPGVYMTKNPPKTYEPTGPSGQLDAPDDPGPSDD